jgi:ABC-2 type transport system ATP-binding protein
MIQLEHVSIYYKIGDFKDIGLKEYVMRKLTRTYHEQTFQAVDDVSFRIDRGEMLGIIGKNGAGKSTMLKAVSGIMQPSCGRITLGGNVVALLELGSGFDPDLTVAENTYLRGAMLGYTRKFMDEQFDSIITYAELETFIDRPFRQLSTGMKSRLAFSIASMVRPDILILDEVLSVGDGAFRAKSEMTMLDIIKGGATTVLVSHSMQQIRKMSNKVLWLEHGKQIAFGPAESVCDAYEEFLITNQLPAKP